MKQRAHVRMTLLAATIYFVCVGALLAGEWLSLIPEGTATPLIIYDTAGAVGFYLLVRSGWDERLGYQGLAVPQMVYALFSLGLAYATIPVMRGAVLLIGPLILMFGSLTTTPKHCQRMAWFGFAALAVPMAFDAWHASDREFAHAKLIELMFLAVVYPGMGRLAGLLSALRWKLKRQQLELRDALDRIQHLATRDELTGLPNRRHAVEAMALAIESARRRGAALCIGIIDLDHFKRINDTLGHAAGDTVLRAVAEEAVPLLRQTDLLARWGGEEFLIMLSDTEPKAAMAVLDRLRHTLASSPALMALNCPKVTFSAGVTAVKECEVADQAVERADRLLYEAKAQGRDRVLAR